MQRLLPLQPGIAQSYDFLMTNDMNNSEQLRNTGYSNQQIRSSARTETCTSTTASTSSTAQNGNSSQLDISKLLDMNEPNEDNQSKEDENNSDDAKDDTDSISNDPGIQSLLDISLPSPISISSRNDECIYSDFTDSNSQPPMSPMRILRELPSPADAKWFEENMHDFSLSSFLTHLEQPYDQNMKKIKSPNRNVSYNKIDRNVLPILTFKLDYITD